MEVSKDTVYTVGGLELNEEKASVILDGNPVKLTPLKTPGPDTS